MNFKEKLLSTAHCHKDRLAVIDHDNMVNYTYNDLIEFSQGLLESGIENKKIGIFIDKSADYIAAVYAISLSSNSFIPLDPSLPVERLNFIINDSKIDYVLTNEKMSNDPRLETMSIPLISLTKSKQTYSLDYHDDQLFYSIYTSGTTGVPKGVQLSFKGIDNVIQQQIDILELNQDNIYLFLSISFDASLSDIYCALLSASTLYIKESIKKEVVKFTQYINDYKISYTDIPPSFIKLINPKHLPTLKAIIIGGEVADPKTVRDYIEYMKVVNVYGPTEATICTSYTVCDKNWATPYIGKPLLGVEYTVLNEDGIAITEGLGELYISGIQLAIGYTNKKITDERFIMINNTRYYKSGDKVMISTQGIEFIGRIDRQIKHNGQLICLEEIEQAINSLDKVKNISVVYKNKKLYAYYEGHVEKEEIVSFIKTVLPTYMVPHHFINSVIPKTVNGKNDSSSLSKSNTVFEKLSTIFKTILELDELDESASFRDLGADSINLIQLQESLHKLGISIPYNYLFDKNSIEDILNYQSYKPMTKSQMVNDFDFTSIKSPDTQVFVNTDVALITGANGSLGIHLLQQVQPYFKTIYCLIRETSDEAARLKFKASKQSYGLDFNTDNIIVIAISSLSDPFFGLHESRFNQLANEVSHVYHNAANVNNMKTFENLYADNVLSSLNVINFSFTGLLKNINYASSLSVYVSGEHTKNTTFYEDNLIIDDEVLFNGYAQTKWLTDYIMTECNHYHQIKQFRLGLLVPEMFTHKDTSSFLYQVIELLAKETVVPEDNIGACFDFTPVTWAANVIKAISLEPSETHIYNVTTNKKVYYTDIIRLLNKQSITKDEWFLDRNDYLSQLLSILNKGDYMDMNLFEMTYVERFDTHNSPSHLDCNVEISNILKGYIYHINK